MVNFCIGLVCCALVGCGSLSPPINVLDDIFFVDEKGLSQKSQYICTPSAGGNPCQYCIWEDAGNCEEGCDHIIFCCPSGCTDWCGCRF